MGGQIPHVSSWYESVRSHSVLEALFDYSARKEKGRIVFQGNEVKDHQGKYAIFQELGAAPTSMEANRACDAYGSKLAGNLFKASKTHVYQ